MKPELSRQIFEKYSNIKFHENPSGGSRVVLCRRAGGQEGGRTDGRTDTHTTKLIVALRDFANAPKNDQSMQFRERIAVCFQIHTKHINKLCGQNVEFVTVKPDGTYSDHWALKL
jgi:hypothetical protein